VPNSPVNVDSRGESACYPLSSLIRRSMGLSIQSDIGSLSPTCVAGRLVGLFGSLRSSLGCPPSPSGTGALRVPDVGFAFVCPRGPYRIRPVRKDVHSGPDRSLRNQSVPEWPGGGSRRDPPRVGPPVWAARMVPKGPSAYQIGGWYLRAHPVVRPGWYLWYHGGTYGPEGGTLSDKRMVPSGPSGPPIRADRLGTLTI